MSILGTMAFKKPNARIIRGRRSVIAPDSKEMRITLPHMTTHSPSDCLLIFDRETRVFCILAPPRLKSSNRSLAFGKFCATKMSVLCQTIQTSSVSKLTSRSPIPPLCVLEIRRSPNANFGEITHGILGLGQTRLGGLARPQVCLRVTLLNDALGSSQIPARECQFALMFVLHGRFAVPGDALSRVDRTTEEAIFEGAAQTKLRELVTKVGCFEEELFCMCFVLA